MSRALLYAIGALALTSMTWPSDEVQAAALRCAPAGFDEMVTLIGFDGAPSAEEPSGRSDEAILLAQLKTKLSGRVPAGETYYIQRQERGTFQKFSAGTALPAWDCIKVTCPASFPPDHTCWNCTEQVKAPE
jgi:hypothetical protein